MSNDGEFETGLTPEILAEVWPIAPSDRRKHSDIFDDLLPTKDCKNDELFYPALLARVRSDHRFFFRLDQRFRKGPSPKEKNKSFGLRSHAWLSRKLQSDVQFKDLDESHLFPNLAEQNVYELYLLLIDLEVHSGDSLRLPSGKTPPIEAIELSQSSDWIAIRDQLRSLLESLDAPDTAMAEAIRVKSEALLAACIRHGELATVASVLEERREGLLELLEPLLRSPQVVKLFDKISTATADVVDSLESMTDDLLSLDHKAMLAGSARYAADHEYENADRKDRQLMRVRLDEVDVAEAADEAAKAARDKALLDALALFEGGPFAEVADASASDSDTQASTRNPAVENLDQNGASPIVVPQPDADSPAQVEAEMPPDQTEAQPPVASQPVTEPVPTSEQTAENAPPAAAASEPPSDPVVTSQADLPTQDEPAVWSALKPLDAVLTRYLADGNAALAFHLADLAMERGFAPGIPIAALKALVVAPLVTGPYNAASQRMGEALADAMSAVNLADGSGDERRSDRTRALVFAALLRPAILAPDTTAREHLKNLSMRGSLSAFSAIQPLLADLGYDFQPSMTQLAELAGAERQRRLPLAERELQGWWDQGRSAHSVHTPTHMIFHQLLSHDGAFGMVCEAALRKAPGSIETARALILDLSDDRSAQESLIADCEVQMGRPRRDRIRGMALDWACRKLQDGCERLQDWLEAANAENEQADSQSGQMIQRKIGALRKVLEAVEIPDDTAGQGLDGAVQQSVRRAILDLRQLIEGRGPVNPPQRPSEVMFTPLLRLPGGCQPYAPERPEFKDEIANQRDRLFIALQDPASLAETDAQAFEMRRTEGAILSARKLLDRLKANGNVLQDGAAEEQALAESLSKLIRNAQQEVERLQLELATLLNLDLAGGNEVRQWLDELGTIASALAPSQKEETPHSCIPAFDGQREPDIPPDFPELRTKLDEVHRFRDSLRARIIEDQRARLDRIIAEQPAQAEAAQSLITTSEARDLVTVEDMIAQLQKGQILALGPRAEGDDFATFFPSFVEAVAVAPPLELNRGLVIKAAGNADVLGPLDFSHLDADAQRASVQLLERWATVENAMKQTTGNLREPLRLFMETVGFTSVQVNGDKLLIPGKLRRFQMRSDPLVAGRWFLPPVFGSEANGSFPVFLARSEVPDDQLATQLGQAGRESPCILLLFGRMSRQRRESFARVMRRDKQSVLLIDETQVFHLSTCVSDRMERLFICAAPFGYLQPYTTNAGNIPREMFFGRRDEIEKILSRTSDGCLVYGGRQLGKSALLHHVRKLYDEPQGARRAFYLKIDEIGGQAWPAAHLWREIGMALFAEGIGTKGDGTAEHVVGAIRNWLAAEPDRRILMLLDETDAFLAAESRTGFPNLGRLKDLMEESARRFKVVFAGLHNVRRMARAPNSPLVHLGDPICIGPLNTSAASSTEARRLVTEPMRAAGFDYESAELAWDILARVNHYPSLVQVFCKALLEGLGNQPRTVGAGPRWLLARAQIFEGGSAQEINRQIRERFQWTLNLDPRYELIAKALALYRLDRLDGNAAVLRNGLSAEAFADEVAPWWPKGIDRLGIDDFRAFLEEMVDLGVLARYGLRQDRYGLRSAQVAQMLGLRDEIEAQIMHIAEKEPRVDYDAAQFHRRIVMGDPVRRAPLADRALADLFDTARPGPRVLVAAPSVWGTDIAERLRDLGNIWVDDKGPLTAVIHVGQMTGLRSLFSSTARGRQIVIIPANTGWDEKVLEWLARQPLVLSGAVIPICLAEPEWLIDHRQSDAKIPARIILPRPWGEGMLRAWLEEHGLGALDDRTTRARMLAGSGGAAVLLSDAREVFAKVVAAGNDPTVAFNAWYDKQRLPPHAIGLPPRFASLLRELHGLVGDKVEDLTTIEALLCDSTGSDAGSLGRQLRLLSDFGLLASGDLATDGVSLSPLGLLVTRSSD
jgi:hypothetical protein